MSAQRKRLSLPMTWAEIDLNAVKHNFKEIKRLSRQGLRRMDTLIVVKADAYGHGMVKVAKSLSHLGVDMLGVSDVKEGIELRKNRIKQPILLFESTLPSLAKKIIEYKLTPTVCTLELARALNRAAGKNKRKIDIHVKVDTGMGRLGVWHKDAPGFIRTLGGFPYLSIKGIYTHFPAADTDKKFTMNQIDQLYSTVKTLDQKVLIVPCVHASNSMGLAGYKSNILNLARPGLMLYGLYPVASLKRSLKLKPAMAVKSKVIFIKKISKGRSVSYGRTFVAKKRMSVATLPIGYNDGYFRGFSNKASVLVNGVRCPVLGRVTMDQTVVDVTKVKDVRLGMAVTVMGEEKGKSITADDLAKHVNTINYEIVCSLGGRLPKVYKP